MIETAYLLQCQLHHILLIRQPCWFAQLMVGHAPVVSKIDFELSIYDQLLLSTTVESTSSLRGKSGVMQVSQLFAKVQSLFTLWLLLFLGSSIATQDWDPVKFWWTTQDWLEQETIHPIYVSSCRDLSQPAGSGAHCRTSLQCHASSSALAQRSK